MAKGKKPSSNGKPKVEVSLPPLLRERTIRAPYYDMATESQCPTLLSLMQPTHDAEGLLTWEGARVTLAIKSGRLTVTVMCPTGEVEAHVEVPSLVSAIVDLEAMLGSGKVQWDESWTKVKRDKILLAKAMKGE